MTMRTTSYVVGLDLGQTSDFTALAVLEPVPALASTAQSKWVAARQTWRPADCRSTCHH